MKNLNTITKIGILALAMGIFFTTNANADCPTKECIEATINLGEEHSLEMDKIFAEKLASTLILSEELTLIEEALEAEGVISTNNDLVVKILNEADELIYEGNYNELKSEDTLKMYMNKADLLINDGNVAYYMLF